ncbi:alcohol dehydrogenase transcription factor myb/SANT-like domain-containing protein [Ditylenchus destructor]|nr:alcohol dehydrogenase transcription factor myb/SANT-like domain-containing protein [Ditylenchus destructor]
MRAEGPYPGLAPKKITPEQQPFKVRDESRDLIPQAHSATDAASTGPLVYIVSIWKLMSSTWNDFSKLLLIREYLMRPYLYESGHYSRIKRQQGIAEIADVLNSNGINFTATQIFAQLRYLKATYKKHLLKMEQDRLDGKPVSVPSWKFFNHLRFLGELDATAANHTLATRIYPSPTAGRSRAAGQRRAKSVLQPTVGRPLGNWIAKPEAVTSLLNEPEAYFPQSAATRAVSCTTQPDTESELPHLTQDNKTGIKIETVARWSNYNNTHESSAFGHDFGLTFQDQKMAQFPRCTVSLNHASENDDDSTIEGDGDEVSDVAVAGDPDEDQYFRNFGLF